MIKIYLTPYESVQIQKEAYLRDSHDLGPTVVRWIENDSLAYPNLVNSNCELLLRRAAQIKRNMCFCKVILWAAEKLFPTETMASWIRDLRKEVEKDFGKIPAKDHLWASALYLLGKKKKIEIKWCGDVIQPKTIVSRYDQ